MADRPSSPARLADVAARAGVSPATASRALNRPDLVSDGTREAVIAAVAATGYRVHHAARNLRRQRTGMVLALVPNLGNPFFSRIVAALAGGLAPAATGLLVADTRTESGRLAAIEPHLNPTRADGIVLFDGAVPAAGLAGEAAGMPLLMACEWVEGAPALPSVTVQNADGARQAIVHLAGLGHRRVLLVEGPPDNVLTVARRAGAEAGAAATGVVLDVMPGDFGLDAGARAGRAWLAHPGPERPTAVFALSDMMACGFLAEVQRAGVPVPGAVSVIGFDDIEIAPHLLPALTTIHQPRDRIGRCAAETILSLIAGGEAGQRVLPVRLVVRASTGRAPRGGAITGS